nr:protein IQ-DOMAIN 30 isoform X2 [Erigeron canadensis]XP_043617719.1 protein IQ-DOMAIN 30 isoform X2 [Erigeron canadensis]
MGKSPGKWIKTLIFGKKSSRTKQKRWEDGKEASVLLDQVRMTNVALNVCEMGDETIKEHVQHDHSQDEIGTPAPANQTLCITKPIEVNTQNDSDRIKEQAAIDVQAALRGYLARREFWTLKGIRRLQALIRGHLVRRQAISTLHCMFQVVKFQALARGIKIRHSNPRLKEQKRFTQVTNQVVSIVEIKTSTEKLKLLANGFARKIANSSPTAVPLHFHYNSDEANSVLSWLERWSKARCWQLLPKPKAAQPSKFQKPHTDRRSSSVISVEIIASEFDKPIRHLRKVSSSNEPANFIEENPELVLERVKRNLRKVDNPVLQITTSDNTQKITPKPEKLISISKTDEILEEVRENTKEDENVDEKNKLKRRGSVRVNQELAENNDPLKIKKSVPSYMATTVSAKAKLRSQDGLETDPTTLSRRYSLPSLANPKVSLSPGAQTTGKLKNDRSLQLSRDGSVKVNPVEWRL